MNSWIISALAWVGFVEKEGRSKMELDTQYNPKHDLLIWDWYVGSSIVYRCNGYSERDVSRAWYECRIRCSLVKMIQNDMIPLLRIYYMRARSSSEIPIENGLLNIIFERRKEELVHLVHVGEDPHHPQTQECQECEATCKTKVME